MKDKQIVMTREVARRWIIKLAHPEHRFRVYGVNDIKHLPGLMRSLRDGKIAMAGVNAIPDLGLKEGFDSIELWSRDRVALLKLHSWFEKRGYETTGVW